MKEILFFHFSISFVFLTFCIFWKPFEHASIFWKIKNMGSSRFYFKYSFLRIDTLKHIFSIYFLSKFTSSGKDDIFFISKIYFSSSKKTSFCKNIITNYSSRSYNMHFSRFIDFFLMSHYLIFEKNNLRV